MIFNDDVRKFLFLDRKEYLFLANIRNLNVFAKCSGSRIEDLRK